VTVSNQTTIITGGGLPAQSGITSSARSITMDMGGGGGGVGGGRRQTMSIPSYTPIAPVDSM